MNDLIYLLLPAMVALLSAVLIRRIHFSPTALAVGCGIFLAPFIIAVFGCFPSLDDWCAVASVRHDWWSCQREWYLGWSGRVAATALATSWGLIGGPWFASVVTYRIVLVLLMVSLGAVLWDLSKALLRSTSSRLQPRDIALVTTVMASAWIASMPAPTEGLYWLPGALCYSAGAGCGVFAFSCVLHARMESGTAAVWRWRLAVLAALLAPLFSEVVAVLVCTILVFLCFVMEGRNRWRTLAPLLAALLGLTIVAMAPGNIVRSLEAARLGQVPGSHEPLALLLKVVRMSLGFLGDFSLAASAALALLISTQASGKITPGSFRVGGGILLVILMLVGAAAFPLAWTGMSPLRAWNPVSLVVSIGLVAFALYGGATQWAKACLATILVSSLLWQIWVTPEGLVVGLGAWLVVGLAVFFWRKQVSLQTIATALVVGLLWGSSRFHDAVRDVFIRGPGYVVAQQQRLNVLATSAPGSAVLVDRLPGEMPYLFHHEDIDGSEKTWQNVALSSFFGLGSVRAVVKRNSSASITLPTNTTP